MRGAGRGDGVRAQAEGAPVPIRPSGVMSLHENAHLTVMECVMRRDWPCTTCGDLVRKGRSAVLSIEVGVVVNRVFHAQCAPPEVRARAARSP